MNEGRLVFRQITDLIHHEQLERCSRRYPMPRASRTFSVRDHFLAMAFAQITFRESLRDIEACLRGSRHLYAMGIRGNITRTNLAYANEIAAYLKVPLATVNWRIKQLRGKLGTHNRCQLMTIAQERGLAKVSWRGMGLIDRFDVS